MGTGDYIEQTTQNKVEPTKNYVWKVVPMKVQRIPFWVGQYFVHSVNQPNNRTAIRAGFFVFDNNLVLS